MEIVDYRECRKDISPELVDIFRECMEYIAQKIRKNPSLGICKTPEGREIRTTPDMFLRVACTAGSRGRSYASNFTKIPGKGKVFVALNREGKVSGFGKVILNGEEALFSDFYVRPEYHGRGVARRIYEEMKEYAMQNNCSVIVGDALAFRRTLELYEIKGFEITSRVTEHKVGFKSYFPTIRIEKSLR